MGEKTSAEGESRRNTRQKATILDCLKKTEARHVTADELADLLKVAGTPVGKATVYRYLTELEENGRVIRYGAVENGPACFQFIGENSLCNRHYHLLCETCGDIVHFESDRLGKVFKELGANNGFSINQTKIVFYGTCEICKIKKS